MDGLASLGIDDVKHVHQWTPHHRCFGSAKQVKRCGIGKSHARFRISNNYRVANAFQRDSPPLLAVMERALGTIVFSHISRDLGCPNDSSAIAFKRRDGERNL